MDLTDFTPVFVAVITFAATVGGIIVKAVIDGRAEKAKVTREENRATEQSKVAARERVAERARSIADLFLDELQEVRKFIDVQAATGFPIWFERRWRATGDIPFRRAIALVDDPEERNQLTQILDSIDDFQSLAGWKYWTNGEQRWVEETLTLGFDLASTMARGQEPDATFAKSYEGFRTLVTGYYEYQEDQRQIEIAESKARAAENDARKAEIEAGWDSDARAAEEKE
jgi:hypothetical protein